MTENIMHFVILKSIENGDYIPILSGTGQVLPRIFCCRQGPSGHARTLCNTFSACSTQNRAFIRGSSPRAVVCANPTGEKERKKDVAIQFLRPCRGEIWRCSLTCPSWTTCSVGLFLPVNQLFLFTNTFEPLTDNNPPNALTDSLDGKKTGDT